MPSQSSAVQKARAEDQQIRQVEAKESSASASAQAGLNLNILGALSGSLFSRSSKTKESAPDGSEIERETRESAARANGAAQGSLAAYGQGKADVRKKDVRAVETTNHLGIEE